ncbi:MAG: hypothetical protein ACI81R_003024 [Bradymonadia bacterium]|jgi:uncharacterized protein (TIGR03382 family)
MRILSLSLAAAVGGLSAIVVPAAAAACGGFFCSQSALVVQTAERILFMQLDDNTIETHVQISYTGPSEDFAWIVPTPSQPVLSLGSDVIFQTLDAIGPPIEITVGDTVGTCREQPPFQADDTTAMDAGVGGDADGGGVTVIALETVGPFDTAIIQATAVEPMMEWLDTNGYDLPPQTAALLTPYVQGDMYFLALKLTKDASAGDLQPIAMTYTASAPMIPIQLTAIAAADDMPIQTWIIADQYAAPANYAEVEPNHISVITGSWEAAARRAVDSLDERSMTRTFADEAAPLADGFYFEAYEQGLERLRGISDATELYNSIRFNELSGLIQSSPLGLPSLQFCAPVPDSVTEQGIEALDFYNCPDCYLENSEEWTSPGGDACADFIDERLIEPLRRVAGYFNELRTASRFDTWLDADEMDLDPMFCWDDARQARETLRGTRTRYCRDDLYDYEAPTRWDVDGLTLFPNENGAYEGLDALSPVSQITRHGCGQGPDDVVSMENDAARGALQTESRETFLAWFGEVDPADEPGGDGNGGSDDDGGRRAVSGAGCTAASAAGAWPALGALLALGLRRRRRS